ncbi:MAG: sterol desaturase family protein [Gammaproteobacteria bacterium]|nr:sterol desaturase family protein [Gammaproteobacteria bacterium]
MTDNPNLPGGAVLPADACERGALASFIAMFAWPALIVSSGAILAIGFTRGHPAIYFNLSYAWIVLWLFVLEKHLPYRSDWRRNDGQIGADLGHTLLNKGLVQITIIQLMSLEFFANRGSGVIGALPLWQQIIIGLVATEFGLYWAHRLGHEWPLLWRFHAVHHSVKRLWIVNTGRFHFIDSNLSVLASVPFLLATGISMDAIIWVSAITAYVGVLTHCNVAMRCGWLNYLFNTPNLHRWHHSTSPVEGNTNYGQNLLVWDQLFGTWLYKREAGPGFIGIHDRMPRRLLGQLLMPFRWKRYQAAPADSALDL